MTINPKLQILICAFGQNGIDSVARHGHPEVAGIEYLVSLQNPDGDIVIPDRLKRDDFRIITHPTRGLSINRNRAISEATAPLAIISDDDVDFKTEEIKGVVEAFERHPDADILTFKFRSKSSHKAYPDTVADLSTPPRGYYVTSIEIAFRTTSIKNHVIFNESFGIGATFTHGEEQIFIHDALTAGLKAFFIPQFSCRHDAQSTGTRDSNHPDFIMAHGAAMSHLHPWSWPLRIIVHARRNSRPGFFRYIYHTIRGVIRARQKKVFR